MKSTQLRIAVAIFGIPRGAKLTFAPFIENIVKQAKAVGEVRLFGHFFTVKQVTNARSGEGGALDQENFNIYRDFNVVTEPPEQCLSEYNVEAFMRYGDYYGDDFKSVRNLIHQLHSLKTVTKNVQLYQPDAVIFARPDLLYHDKIPSWIIRNAATHPDRCFLPHWQWWGGYNDRFSVCGRNAYLHYGTRIENILNYCSRGNRPLHAERLLRETLRLKNVGLRQLDVRASRVRVGDVVKDESFDARGTIGPRRLLPEMVRSHLLARVHL
ncbi:hypothetical protein J2X15_000911 [Rhodoferax saidenbachensis]|uniref:Uncharacterized protein n=1 Tax=Rhodoferax saidenbachensis TaxID=1484693 RepID=A0ABU1ZJH8_9BURK|nr:hypothetical protein [Rhodoferax saidenbachensis]